MLILPSTPLNDKIIYNGVEGKISLFNLLKSMNIKYTTQAVEKLELDSDENKEEITVS